MNLMQDPVSYMSAFMIGLLAGAHCVGMCGGIVNALSFAADTKQNRGMLMILLAYNMGRIGSYMLVAAFIGGMSIWLMNLHVQMSFLLRIVAGLMLIAMGLYLSGWWLGLRYLEQAGNLIWKKIEPAGRKLMPVRNVSQALMLGAIWGWLPCGMVYSVLAWSATSGNWYKSIFIMLFFGLGTLPVMLITGHFSYHFKIFVQHRITRSITAILMIGFGVWTILATNYIDLHHQVH